MEFGPSSTSASRPRLRAGDLARGVMFLAVLLGPHEHVGMNAAVLLVVPVQDLGRVLSGELTGAESRTAAVRVVQVTVAHARSQ